MTTTTATTKLVRPLRGGQMTIPAELRRQLGIDEETMLRVTLADGELRIRPVRVEEPSKGSPGLRALYEYFAPGREEILASGISEEELFAEIDAAIAEVRAEKREADNDASVGSPWLRELYEYFAPVREEILAMGISEDEVNADIDAAIEAVRNKRHPGRR